MKISLKDIQPNPYRAYNVNPINESKIEKLVESIQETGLWGVIVRPSPTTKGKYEQAFGHHRLEAARRAGLEIADVNVQDLSNEQMIMMLARDNDEVYDSSVLSVIESVYGVVKGLADGSLQPIPIPEKTNKDLIRYAPSFVPGEPSSPDSGEHVPYTALGIAKLLGYTKKNGTEASNAVTAALGALYLMQIDRLKAESIANMSVEQLLLSTREAIARIVEKKKQDAERAKNAAAVAKAEADKKAFLAEQQAKVNAERAKIAELEAEKRKAREEENERRAKALEESIAKRKLKEEERKELIKRELPKFEEKFAKAKAEAKENEKEAKEKQAARQAAIAASTLIGKFERLSGKPTATNTKKQLTYKEAPTPQFLDEVSKAARNKDISANDRELLRQAMVAVGDWFIENSNLFLPIKKVDVLKEAQLKEEAKRKSTKETK